MGRGRKGLTLPSSAELSLSSCKTSSSLEIEIISSSESMLVDAVVTGVGGEPCVGWAAAAEVLLLGWESLIVEDNFASAAFLLRDLGGMVTGEATRRRRPESCCSDAGLLWVFMGWDRMRWDEMGCEGGRRGSKQAEYRVEICKYAGRQASRQAGEERVG